MIMKAKHYSPSIAIESYLENAVGPVRLSKRSVIQLLFGVILVTLSFHRFLISVINEFSLVTFCMHGCLT